MARRCRSTIVLHARIRHGPRRLRWKGPLTFETGPAPHFRELRLEWGNGAVWSLKLDQGVGYWRCRPSSDFPFDKRPHEQLQAINEIAKRCRVVSQGSHPTYIYVAAEQSATENHIDKSEPAPTPRSRRAFIYTPISGRRRAPCTTSGDVHGADATTASCASRGRRMEFPLNASAAKNSSITSDVGLPRWTWQST